MEATDKQPFTHENCEIRDGDQKAPDKQSGDREEAEKKCDDDGEQAEKKSEGRKDQTPNNYHMSKNTSNIPRYPPAITPERLKATIITQERPKSYHHYSPIRTLV